MPALRYELEYDDAERITRMTHCEVDCSMSYRFEYDAEGRLISRERIVENPILSESSYFIYDEAGRLVKEGSRYDVSYQYEDNMLVAFGRFFTVHNYAGYPIYAHHSIYDLDTVLLLPKEIF